MAEDTLKIIITAEDGVTKPAKQAQVGLEGIGKTAMELKAKLDLAREGVEIFAGVFKQAFELGKEGAMINQINSSFEGLMGTQGRAVEMEGRLSDAVRGTMSGEQLRGAMLKMLTGAEGEFADRIKETAPMLYEMAAATAKLNPMMGDTNSNLEAISQSLEMGTARRLKQLGIIIDQTKAEEDYAKKIGTSRDALTTEQQKVALLDAALEYHDTLMRQVGGNVESAIDPFNRLSVSIEETADKIKTALAPMLADAADGLNLMLTGVDKLNAVSAKHAADVSTTAKSYAEYTAEIKRTNDALPSLGIGLKGILSFDVPLTKQVTAMTEAEWNHNQVVLKAIADAPKYADGHDLVAQATARLATQTKNLNKDEKAAGDQIAELAMSRKQTLKQSAQDLNEAYDAMLAKTDETKTKHEESERDLLAKLAKMNRDYTTEVGDAAGQLNEQLAVLTERRAEQVSKIGSDILLAQRAFNKQTEDDARALGERLDELAQSHADRVRDINERMGDLTGNYEERKADRQVSLNEQLANFDEEYEKKRADTALKVREQFGSLSRGRQNIQLRLALAALDEQEAAERAKLDAKAAKVEAKAKAEYDKALAKLQEQIARENAEYDKQEAKLKADAVRKAAEEKATLDEKLATLTANLNAENVEYDKQKAKLTTDAEEKRIRKQAEFEEQTAAVQAQIDKENLAYGAQTNAIALEYVKQKQQLDAHLTEVDVTYGQAIDKLRAKLLEAGITQDLISFIVAQGQAAGQSLFQQYVTPGASVGEGRRVPGFQFGGTVPGPLGAPMLAMVHGGEEISPVGGLSGGGNFTFVYAPMLSLADEREAQTRLAPVLNQWWANAKRTRTA